MTLAYLLFVDIVDKLIYNIIVKILQAPSRDKQFMPNKFQDLTYR